MADDRLRVLAWNVHGNYLHALSHVPCLLTVPVDPDGRPGYTAPTPQLDWPETVQTMPPDQLRNAEFDVVIYQSRDNLSDAAQLLTASQRARPCIYIEHNPPEPHPVDTWHPFRHPRGMLVHVTHFNAAMWLAPDVVQRVIEHGMPDAGPGPQIRSSRGVVVINHLHRRGRRLGLDLFTRARQSLALDLIGMESERNGGLGEISNRELVHHLFRYGYFFTPIRYASLGLSVVQAMLCSLPVVGFAATELNSVVRNGSNGYIDTCETRWLEAARALQDQPALARAWGNEARKTALERFGMARFVDDWRQALNFVRDM